MLNHFAIQQIMSLFLGLVIATSAVASTYLEGCIADQQVVTRRPTETMPSKLHIERYCRCVKEDVETRGMPSQVETPR